ncbi:MAG: hypothetical protein V1659_03555 [Candidatus Woesearchaeota archaeon]
MVQEKFAAGMQKLLKEKSVEDVFEISAGAEEKRMYVVVSSQPAKTKIALLGDDVNNKILLLEPMDLFRDKKIFMEILERGKSLKLKKRLCEHLEIEKYFSFEYSLTNLDSVKKQTFSHSLYGTGGRESFLKKLNGRKLGKNNVLIPVSGEAGLVQFFRAWNIRYNKICVWLENNRQKE